MDFCVRFIFIISRLSVLTSTKMTHFCAEEKLDNRKKEEKYAKKKRHMASTQKNTDMLGETDTERD